MPEPTPLIQALLDPGTYPHGPKSVQLLQTQMSLLFLTGDYVYKVKKPVDLGYLDYTTLEKREFFCHQELTLNRRLCPDVYLEVVPVVRQTEEILLGGEGEVIDYAVKMRQLPPDRMMDVLLSRNQVTQEMVQQVAQKVAVFHQQAETNAEIGSYGSLDLIRANANENFSQTEQYVGLSIYRARYDRIKTYTDTFIDQRASLFESRPKAGKIRDCHGDLHSAHVCFVDDISIYDCIEFNDRFRYCDVAAEVAFLAMDLDYYGQPELAKGFTDAYVEASKDEQLLDLLGFYKCYRAYVRGKVESFKLDDRLIPEEEKTKALDTARRYFELADSYI
jgi:aminoglycoside phosphotransferase family enzyme